MMEAAATSSGSFFSVFPKVRGQPSLLHLTDLSVGDSRCPADSAHQEEILQQSDEDGDRLVRLHLCGRAQHSHVRVSVTAICPGVF